MVAVWDRIRRFFRGIDTLIVAAPGTVIDWACYEGKWYVGSALFHAVTLLSLALIAVSCPRTLVLPPDQEPTFDAAEVARNAMPPPVERFEVGNAPLDPTELNAETLKQTKAMPVGGQTAKYYDDSSEFEEARGGVVADAKGPKLGGIGGFSVADLPGPAARGTAGWGGGGPGTGFGLRNKGHRAEILGPAGGTKASERAVGRGAQLALSPPERIRQVEHRLPAPVQGRNLLRRRHCSFRRGGHRHGAPAVPGRWRNAPVQRAVSADGGQGPQLAHQAATHERRSLWRLRSAHVRPWAGHHRLVRGLWDDP